MRSLGMLFLSGAAVAEMPSKPNIILILSDDHGWSQTSALMDPAEKESKSTYLETPNLDRIAREGMRFTSGYSPAPLCTPTRRSILCGTATARSGTEFPSETGWVPKDHMTIPFALKAANPDYQCAHFGKWGGHHMRSTPEESGYDASNGVTDNPEGGMPETLGYTNHNDAPPYFIDNEDPKRTFSITSDSIAFMREQVAAGKPFYIQASYYAAHLSIVCKQSTLDKYIKKGTPDRGYTPAYAAMVEDMDTGIGLLLKELDDLGIADNTYVFFTADNGARGDVPGGDKSRLALNHPLTGAKQQLYEGGVRVPFLVRGPGIKADSASRVPVCGYDYLPTFYSLAGGKTKLPAEVDGTDISPLMFDSPAEWNRAGDALFFHRPNNRISAVRQGDYKLMLNWTSLGTIRSKELYYVDENAREEGFDITAKNPEKAEQLQKLLLDYLQNVGAYTPPAPAIPGADGMTIIYENSFDGEKGTRLDQSATVRSFLHSVNLIDVDGNGRLIPSMKNAGSGFRVMLSETPVATDTIRLSTTVKAPVAGAWMGIGFAEKSVAKLNDFDGNTGPWIMIQNKNIRLRGGTMTNGTDIALSNTHSPGDMLELNLIYQTKTQKADLFINGIKAVDGKVIEHIAPPGTKAAPKIKFLNVQFFTLEPDDGAAFDFIRVETK